MKQVLMMVLAAAVMMFIGGCHKGSDEEVSPVVVEGVRPKPPGAEPRREPQRPDISRGLVGWWKFDEASGTVAADSSGRGRAGTLREGAGFDKDSVEGRIGKGLYLSEGAYVQIEGYKGITGTAPRTVAAWMKTKRDNGSILSWGVEEGGGMFIFGFVPGRGRIGLTPQGGYLYMKARSNDDTWHHVAAVVEEAEVPNLHDNAKVFLDGTIAEIHDIGILDLWPIDTGSDLDVMIGKGFEGVLDDVRLYDRALSQREIELLFKTGPK